MNACKSSNTTRKQTDSTESKKELEELYWQRVEDSRSSYTEADVKFMTGMIAHHAQALVMSRLAPHNGASPQVRTLTSRIINAQRDEIKTMQQWLRDRGETVPKISIDSLQLTITLDEKKYTKYRQMKGVLTQQQIVELAKAKNTEFDRLFLTYMIEHHAGAVSMVDKLFNTDGAAQDGSAFRLASDIQVDQRTEIDRMFEMLEALPETD
ncbi:DUF305 domain-containing protein [Aliifodinibius halophilus]|uniref:DUF305 domain-containing protein n=2 Tax=Fodinibius halophilus TaxID=1736908 RepID=A0A6M1T6D4_9BACT|nr:DUF305 domain-containing protein [Fodinibius halophilus]NGP89667.1 DUF305 domain-containing protein [Fodinibius halophilus]